MASKYNIYSYSCRSNVFTFFHLLCMPKIFRVPIRAVIRASKAIYSELPRRYKVTLAS